MTLSLKKLTAFVGSKSKDCFRNINNGNAKGSEKEKKS